MTHLYYIVLQNTPNDMPRYTYARASNKERVYEMVYTNLPTAKIHKLGLVTEPEYVEFSLRDLEAERQAQEINDQIHGAILDMVTTPSSNTA